MASGTEAAMATGGHQATARIIACDQLRGRRQKQKANGAAEPTNERTLSAGVRPGCRPWISPIDSIAR